MNEQFVHINKTLQYALQCATVAKDQPGAQRLTGQWWSWTCGVRDPVERGNSRHDMCWAYTCFAFRQMRVMIDVIRSYQGLLQLIPSSIAPTVHATRNLLQIGVPSPRRGPGRNHGPP